MNELFSEWVLEQMKDRQWTQAKLAKSAGVSRAAISNILSEHRQPGPELCMALSSAFKYPPEDVFRKAGLLPPKPNGNPKVEEIKEIAIHMGELDQDDLLEYARMKLRVSEERGRYDNGSNKK